MGAKMSNGKKRLWLTAVILIILMVNDFWGMGCVHGKNQRVTPKLAAKGYPLQITDSYRRRVTITRAPRRIISLAPNITETIFALKKGRLLAGRTNFCDYPAAARQVASVGEIQNPNLEKILQLQPDLVIASTHFRKEVLAKLEELGIKTVILYGEESFTGVYEIIRQVGRIVGAGREAGQVVARMKREAAWVAARVKNRPRPRVYYVVSFGRAGNYTAGRDTFIAKMLTLAGGVNVADDSRGWQYSLEKLTAKNPEIIICSKYFHTKAALRKAVGYRDLPAVKAGRLYEIDSNLLDRQGPRLTAGLVALARLIHPEVFTEKSRKQ
jgi:iron complex transport system substrate-binding protein